MFPKIVQKYEKKYLGIGRQCVIDHKVGAHIKPHTVLKYKQNS